MKGNDFDFDPEVLDWVKKSLSKKRCSICGLVKEELAKELGMEVGISLLF